MTDATPISTPNRGPRDPVGLAALQIAAALERSAAALERMATALEGLTVEPADVAPQATPQIPPRLRPPDPDPIPDGGAFVDGADGVEPTAPESTGDPVEDLLAQIEATEEP